MNKENPTPDDDSTRAGGSRPPLEGNPPPGEAQAKTGPAQPSAGVPPGNPFDAPPTSPPAGTPPFPPPPFPSHGPPPGYPYYSRRPTNVMAVMSLVMAFTFAPLGIVFGIMAKRQIAKTGEEGEGLATAGLWISVAFTGLLALAVLLFVIMVAVALSGVAMAHSAGAPFPS